MSFGLGSWRLFLAVLVALSHLWADMLHGPAAYAVWGFFVLSGFLMTYVLQTKYHGSLAGLGAYAYNRFLRIFPGFWVACVVGAIVLGWLAGAGVDARQLNPSFGTPRDAAEWGFVMTLLPAFPRWNAPVPVANALAIEVGYYLLMPLLARHRSSAWLALVFGCLIVADHGLASDSFGPRYAWFLPAAPAFALGALLCHYRAPLARLASPRASVAVWVAHWGVFALDPSWPWTFGLYVSALLSAWVVISLAPIESRGLDSLFGELSYPFYLLHSTAGAALLFWFGYDRPLAFALLGLLLTLAGSWAMVRFIDRPLTRRKKRSAPRPGTAATPASAAPVPAQPPAQSSAVQSSAVQSSAV